MSCADELPVLAAAKSEFESRGVTFLLLSVHDEDAATVNPWLEAHGGTGLATGTADVGGAEQLHRVVGRQFQFIPATVFLSADGRVTQVLGDLESDELRKSLRRIAD